MKKYICALLFALVPLAVFAQEQESKFTFDGEIKTGFISTKEENYGQDPVSKLRLGSLDDAGDGQGRIRINFTYAHENTGIKGRVQWDNWQEEKRMPTMPYLFGYVNNLDDQLTVSMGKLGASPWGTGGPEMWKELESISEGSGGGGVRTEFKPNFAPGLNVGFVLNYFNGSMDLGLDKDRQITLADILRETVLGISYENDYFLVRFAYRLDSDMDVRPGSSVQTGGVDEGDDLIYRVEERVIQNYLPGFQIWALGTYEGVGAESEVFIRYINWLFFQYAPDLFTAQIRLGYNVVATRSILHVKPSYYHNFFNKVISIGAAFYIAQDFGDDRLNNNAAYIEMQFEPMIRINLTNAYVAFVYNLTQKTKQPQPDADFPIDRIQTMNLRFGMRF